MKTVIAALLLCLTIKGYAQSQEIIRIVTPEKTYAILTADVDSMTFGGICPDGNHPHSIDMGCGVNWACCSLDAKAPEKTGKYYAWGETSSKNYFWNDNYPFYDEENEEFTLRIDISGTRYDAASANWHGNWVMPTKADAEELLKKCTCVLTNYHDVNGFLVTAPNGNCLFFPLSGGYALAQRIDFDKMGYYWLSTPDEGGLVTVLQFSKSSRAGSIEPTYPQIGLSIRPVERITR